MLKGTKNDIDSRYIIIRKYVDFFKNLLFKLGVVENLAIHGQ